MNKKQSKLQVTLIAWTIEEILDTIQTEQQQKAFSKLITEINCSIAECLNDRNKEYHIANEKKTI